MYLLVRSWCPEFYECSLIINNSIHELLGILRGYVLCDAMERYSGCWGNQESGRPGYTERGDPHLPFAAAAAAIRG